MDQLEPNEAAENLYREAAQRGLAFLFGVIQFLHDAKSDRERGIRLIAVSVAIQHPAIGGATSSSLAARLGITRAAMSKHVVAFERGHNLPPAFSQKSTEARNSYRETRQSQLNG